MWQSPDQTMWRQFHFRRWCKIPNQISNCSCSLHFHLLFNKVVTDKNTSMFISKSQDFPSVSADNTQHSGALNYFGQKGCNVFWFHLQCPIACLSESRTRIVGAKDTLPTTAKPYSLLFKAPYIWISPQSRDGTREGKGIDAEGLLALVLGMRLADRTLKIMECSVHVFVTLHIQKSKNGHFYQLVCTVWHWGSAYRSVSEKLRRCNFCLSLCSHILHSRNTLLRSWWSNESKLFSLKKKPRTIQTGSHFSENNEHAIYLYFTSYHGQFSFLNFAFIVK